MVRLDLLRTDSAGTKTRAETKSIHCDLSRTSAVSLTRHMTDRETTTRCRAGWRRGYPAGSASWQPIPGHTRSTTHRHHWAAPETSAIAALTSLVSAQIMATLHSMSV